MTRYLQWFGLPAISLTLLVFGVLHIFSAEQVVPASPPLAMPPRSPYGQGIAASGMVEPQSENIAIGAPLAGVVCELFVPSDAVGTTVSAGDPLFRVDDRHLRSELAVQQALLAAPRSELARLESLPRSEEVPPAQFKVTAARANLDRAEDAYRRLERLARTQAIAEGELIESLQAKQFAAAELDRAQAELDLLMAGAWEADLAVVRANVAQVEAQIARIETELERSLVRAPVDSVVLQVNVRPGEYVAAPPTKDLVVLGDMRQPHVRVDIDESDIPRFVAGAAARGVIRGDSSRSVALTFVRVEPYVIPKRSLTGANTERVDTRVLQVIYAVADPQAELFVGQQLDVFIEAVPKDSRAALP
ncbi:MAG TPA: efflux RND transporter periplasmic adaptor subunit [Pirellulaceae bacterium]|nr:efflux RND transporter periplasmic adaptor subunit [Pirellulaceae bacterium]